MARSGEDDTNPNDTVRVERLDLESTVDQRFESSDLAATLKRPPPSRYDSSQTPPTDPSHASRYAHVPSPDDMTPLPPPHVQASIIAEEASHTGPLPLPPAPSMPSTGTRPLERASLGPRRIALPGPLGARQLVDPGDAAWTLALWATGAALGGMALVTALVGIVDGVRAQGIPVWALMATAALALLFPSLLGVREVMAARVRAAGIEIGPNQLRGEWQTYVDVAVRLGVRNPPPLFLYPGGAAATGERWLLPLARRRVLTVSPRELMNPEALELALGRELGALLVGHGEPLDIALLLPVRALFLVLTGLLRVYGLGFSPLNPLWAARVHTTDRAACVGTGQLGLVLDDIMGGGDRQLAVRIDLQALIGQKKRQGDFSRLLHRLTSPVPSPGERAERLQKFAQPHLLREG